jgi:hypothetical protein
MAMRMVTIFVALIVCGMLFPGLARGADLSVNTELYVPLGKVEVGEEKITSVEITNESDKALTIWPTLDRDATCPEGYFEYTGPDTGLNYYQMEAYGTVTVQVTFKPLTVGTWSAWLTIMPIGSNPYGVQPVKITFTGEGAEKSSETFIEIGGFNTGVTDREAKLDENNSTLGEMIGECEATAYNCGQLRRCVKRLTRQLMREGTINYQEMRALHRAAMRAEIHKMVQDMKASRRLKTNKISGKSKWWCWWRH